MFCIRALIKFFKIGRHLEYVYGVQMPSLVQVMLSRNIRWILGFWFFDQK